MNATTDRIFYPHISTEALPLDVGWSRTDPLKTLSNLAHQMGLALVRLTLLPKIPAVQKQETQLYPAHPPPASTNLEVHDDFRDDQACPVRREEPVFCAATQPLFNAQQ